MTENIAISSNTISRGLISKYIRFSIKKIYVIWNKIRNTNLYMNIGGAVLVFPFFFKSEFLWTLLRKKFVKFFQPEDANILVIYYMQYFTQAHKILVSSNKKKKIFLLFLTNSRESPILRTFCWKMNTAPSYFSVSNLIPHDIYTAGRYLKTSFKNYF